MIPPLPSSIHLGRDARGPHWSPGRGEKGTVTPIELQNKISAEHIQRLVGTKQEVLVEGTDGQGLVGRTRTNRQVHFAGSQELMGELVTVEITEAGTWTLRGRVVQPQA